MDITSLNLPVAGGAYPRPLRTAVVPDRTIDRAVVAVQATGASDYVPYERVIQGEVLERERADSRTTHDFLQGRTFNQPGEETVSPTSGRAIGAYQASARVTTAEDVNPARQVDYYI